MATNATISHLAIFDGHSAKRDKQFAVVPKNVPARRAIDHGVKVTKHIRKRHFCSGVAIGVNRVGKPANRVEEALELALCVVKAASTGPAIRATENRLVPELAAHPFQLCANQLYCRFPRNLYEIIAPSLPPITSRTILQPTFTNHWLFNP